MADPATIIRVMVVDDHLVIRQGLETMLRVFPDITLVGEAHNGEQALNLCDELRPDIVLMDMIMPQMSGVEATRTIRKKYPDTQVIAMTSFSDDKQLVQAATEAGAIGYIFKDVAINELADAIRTAHQGLPAIAPNAIRLLIQAKSQRSPDDFNLSEREMDVLRLLVEGLSNQEISERLSVSLATIKFHVSSILHKLGASSRTEAVTMAYQYKLVT